MIGFQNNWCDRPADAPTGIWRCGKLCCGDFWSGRNRHTEKKVLELQNAIDWQCHHAVGQYFSVRCNYQCAGIFSFICFVVNVINLSCIWAGGLLYLYPFFWAVHLIIHAFHARHFFLHRLCSHFWPVPRLCLSVYFLFCVIRVDFVQGVVLLLHILNNSNLGCQMAKP